MAKACRTGLDKHAEGMTLAFDAITSTPDRRHKAIVEGGMFDGP